MLKMIKTFLFLLTVLLRVFSACFLFGKEGENSQVASSTSKAAPLEKTNICLNMLVKNDAKIIECCLNSVKDVVDCISICDTGSTDNTIEMIEQFMQKNKIPGKVHRHAWKNAGHNRSLSFQATQSTLQELGFSLPATFLLLLDADMVFEVDPSFKKSDLTADSFLILQKNQDFSFYIPHLIRASLPWKCKGITHEYWTCNPPASETRLDSLKVYERGDSETNANKRDLDLTLLIEGLKEEPSNLNPRCIFHLAQAYKHQKKFNEAIIYYKNRISLGGDKEEVWYSKMMMGEIYEELDFWDQALHWYLDAYQANPERAEPLQKIATHYRVRGQCDLAYLFARQGLQIPFPKDQKIFISHPVYDYRFDEEISIAAFYIPAFKEEGFAAADRLAFKKTVPPHIKDQTYRNLFFYVQNLSNAQFQSLDPTSTQVNPKKDQYEILIRYGSGYDFSRFRSSVAPLAFDDGYLMLVYESVETDTPRNYLHRFVYLDKDLQIKKLSLPFIFKQKGLEYCDSMTFDSSSKKFLIPIRIEDREAWLCSIDSETVRSLLKPLPPLRL